MIDNGGTHNSAISQNDMKGRNAAVRSFLDRLHKNCFLGDLVAPPRSLYAMSRRPHDQAMVKCLSSGRMLPLAGLTFLPRKTLEACAISPDDSVAVPGWDGEFYMVDLMARENSCLLGKRSLSAEQWDERVDGCSALIDYLRHNHFNDGDIAGSEGKRHLAHLNRILPAPSPVSAGASRDSGSSIASKKAADFAALNGGVENARRLIAEGRRIKTKALAQKEVEDSAIADAPPARCNITGEELPVARALPAAVASAAEASLPAPETSCGADAGGAASTEDIRPGPLLPGAVGLMGGASSSGTAGRAKRANTRHHGEQHIPSDEVLALLPVPPRKEIAPSPPAQDPPVLEVAAEERVCNAEPPPPVPSSEGGQLDLVDEAGSSGDHEAEAGNYMQRVMETLEMTALLGVHTVAQMATWVDELNSAKDAGVAFLRYPAGGVLSAPDWVFGLRKTRSIYANTALAVRTVLEKKALFIFMDKYMRRTESTTSYAKAREAAVARKQSGASHPSEVGYEFEFEYVLWRDHLRGLTGFGAEARFSDAGDDGKIVAKEDRMLRISAAVAEKLFDVVGDDARGKGFLCFFAEGRFSVSI